MATRASTKVQAEHTPASLVDAVKSKNRVGVAAVADDTPPKTVPNFFSDGELTPELASPAVSRPPTPKSDTELELSEALKHKRQQQQQTTESNQWSWSWGQLPERQGGGQQSSGLAASSGVSENLSAAASVKESSPLSSSLLGSMFGSMKTSKVEGKLGFVDVFLCLFLSRGCGDEYTTNRKQRSKKQRFIWFFIRNFGKCV